MLSSKSEKIYYIIAHAKLQVKLNQSNMINCAVYHESVDHKTKMQDTTHIQMWVRQVTDFCDKQPNDCPEFGQISSRKRCSRRRILAAY